MEHKSKGESLEKCQAELKKLRRKSQGSKNPSKYGDKEMQVSLSLRLTGVTIHRYWVWNSNGLPREVIRIHSGLFPLTLYLLQLLVLLYDDLAEFLKQNF